MRLKRVWKLVPQGGKKRKGDKAQQELGVQDQKVGGRTQRDHRPVCDGEVIDPMTRLHYRRFQ